MVDEDLEKLYGDSKLDTWSWISQESLNEIRELQKGNPNIENLLQVEWISIQMEL